MQDMGKVPHSPACAKQQSPDLAPVELFRSHQILYILVHLALL